MKRILIFLFMATAFFNVQAQNKEANYNESKVPTYVLPDVLLTNDGEKIKSVNQWITQRRPEILSLFSSQVYGITPGEKINIKHKLLSESKKALNGKATCKQIEFTYSKGKKEIKSILLLFLPNDTIKKAPVFVGFNFKGNETLCNDSTILMSSSSEIIDSEDLAEKRGSTSKRWPLELIIDSGFAVATMCYQDIYIDKPESGYKDKSVLSLFDNYENTQSQTYSWQAMGAWAWGLSRIADYLETSEKRIDKSKIIAIGHSRLAKTALWAGAQDTRFSVVISNNSGCGGAALSRRKFGETVAVINKNFPHWFCVNFRQYNDKEENLPVDQHELIALMAPRPVYIASASEDLWADPKGEFLSGLNANPVYALWGLTGLPAKEMPGVDKPVLNGFIGYHIRSGKHDILEYDWLQYIRFAQNHFAN
jgi:hypothetical protein